MCKFDSATRPLFAAHRIYTRGKRGEVYFMHLQRAFEAAVNLHVQLLLLSEACEAKVDFQRPGTVPYPHFRRNGGQNQTGVISFPKPRFLCAIPESGLEEPI